jgi:hypothetical protein
MYCGIKKGFYICQTKQQQQCHYQKKSIAILT